jgi:hypothetical protein
MFDALTASYPQVAEGSGLSHKGVDQSGFANPGLSGYEHHLAFSMYRSGQTPQEVREFLLPADQIGTPAFGVVVRLGKLIISGQRLTAVCRRNESISSMGQRLDELRRVGVVSKRKPQIAYVATQYRCADMGIGPYRFDQLRARHQASRSRRQVCERRKRLGTQWHKLGASP